jgi:hypothetical protein
MTPRERFRAVLEFRAPDDRMPMVEWAAWWDTTFNRWKTEGLPADMGWDESLRHFGLDPLVCIGASGIGPNCPRATSHGGAIVRDESDYEAVLPHLYADATIEALLASAVSLKERHDRGEIVIRLWLDGFFWFPRILLGIEPHLYAFHDQPALLHRINEDLTHFNLRAVEALFPVLKPDMVGFAEDMSYNHGPMLSQRQFEAFLAPYYRRLNPAIAGYGVRVLVDSDGDITRMAPWLLDVGIEGVYPLERQAGVDVAALRRQFPSLLMMGGYDKMVMPLGEAAMRAEFERLLPVMRGGGFIPSVDHQTPPGVSLENYRIYISLFREYAERAVRG